MPGPSVFPSGDPSVSGDFWGSQEGCQGPFRPSGRNRGLPLRRRRGQGPTNNNLFLKKGLLFPINLSYVYNIYFVIVVYKSEL